MLLCPPRAVTVPEEVSITDPAGDANYLNDQGFAGTGVTANGQTVAVPDSDDNTTPADAGNASDILKVWFSNETDTVSAHFVTELPPPANQGLVYRIQASPGEGEVASSATGCLWFEAYIAGVNPQSGQRTTYQGSSFGRLRDICNLGSGNAVAIPGEFATETLEDGTGLTTITVPRDGTPLLAADQTLTAPYMEVRNLTGGDGIGTVTAPVIDTTKVGLDFVLDAEGGGGGGGGDPVKCLGLEDIKGNHVVGTPDADVLRGTPKRDVICALGGEDVLKSFGGNDLLIAAEGFDKMYAGPGKDQLLGGAGNDGLNGGPGNDKLAGGADNDRLFGNLGKDKCKGGAGYDFRKACE